MTKQKWQQENIQLKTYNLSGREEKSAWQSMETKHAINWTLTRAITTSESKHFVPSVSAQI